MKRTKSTPKPDVATPLECMNALPHTTVCENVIEQEALAHIRTDAYHRWELAGCPAGDGSEFWLAAERAYLAAHARPDASGTTDVVQEASEESFPASDPPARTISPVPVAYSSTVTAS